MSSSPATCLQQCLSPEAAAAPHRDSVWGAAAWRRGWWTECLVLQSPSPTHTASRSLQTVRHGSENTHTHTGMSQLGWKKYVFHQRISNIWVEVKELKGLGEWKEDKKNRHFFELKTSEYWEEAAIQFPDWPVQIWALLWSWCCQVCLPAPCLSSSVLQGSLWHLAAPGCETDI